MDASSRCHVVAERPDRHLGCARIGNAPRSRKIGTCGTEPCRGAGRQRTRFGELDFSYQQRRITYHRLYRVVRFVKRWGHGVGQRSGKSGGGAGPDERPHLHLHGDSNKRGWNKPPVDALELVRLAGHRAWRANDPNRDGWDWFSVRGLHGSDK